MTKRSEHPRIGVAGAGTMGQHHVRILSQYPGVHFTGLYDPDPERAAEVCGRHGCLSFPTLEELLENVDAMTVAAPTTWHAEIGTLCLERGIHVLMEKPLAHDVESAAGLLSLSRASGAVLMVGHIERYNPAIGKLMEMLRNVPEEIISIDARRLAPFDGSRCIDVDVLYDLLIHDIDLALEIADSDISRVSATGRPVYSSQNDTAHAVIEFRNRAVASFWTAKCLPTKVRTTTVATPGRYLVADTLSRSLTVYTADRVPTKGMDVCFMGDIRREEIAVPDDEPLRLEIEDFIRAIREGCTPIVDGERALRAMMALDLVARSINSTCG
ncbi:MAG: Gfo/Idh/MocA family oxidoreductase [Desulfomonilaceae bacterium]|nr:Gfo/Idh/MocA family oxidoreductase [Desulfomonilaceae bacterium]